MSLLAFLEGTVWPALGISEPLALALSAWVHFRCGGVHECASGVVVCMGARQVWWCA